jgi:hypothetical protein
MGGRTERGFRGVSLMARPSLMTTGYMRVVCRNMKDRRQLEHRVIVEELLGRALSSKVSIHHLDGDRSNNAHDNLVVCEDAAYHRLLHKRAMALIVTGNPKLRRCCVCGLWKEESDYWMRHQGKYMHNRCKTCNREGNKNRYKQRIGYYAKFPVPTLREV